jgi:hypothetical protein
MTALYISDITVSLPPNSVSFKEYVKIFRRRVLRDGKLVQCEIAQTKTNLPVLLEEGESFPSEKYRDSYIRKHFDPLYAGKKVEVRFDNVRFSSKLHYTYHD